MRGNRGFYRSRGGRARGRGGGHLPQIYQRNNHLQNLPKNFEIQDTRFTQSPSTLDSAECHFFDQPEIISNDPSSIDDPFQASLNEFIKVNVMFCCWNIDFW